MAVMTSTGSVVRITSDAPVHPALLIPAQRTGPSIAAALPIRRDRRARRAVMLLLSSLAIIAAVMIIARSAG